ncbi:hypothetical protein AURDEDRAFT_175533 [Auricularia subglabra TFB-10046 SS5]|uniref:Uncharacterized protein n=1 Tax=Auricularia subglabra (strain TFB-10046 / SS5) TaxID=717982 RepID=J0WRN1_AURST|nr:hypothetical protein AURDEDRAFT_175533 [Auricularia subglabra TFB-10046 SS5]
MHFQPHETGLFGAEERRLAHSPVSHALCLPNELWCIIWENLALSGRLCVSQVCSRWRNTALASPCLWTTLEFVSPIHPPGCLCAGCQSPPPAGKAQSSAAPTTSAMTLPASFSLTSLSLLRELLARSVHLQLTLTVDIISAQSVDLQALSATLQPHFPRVAVLHIVSAHVDVPGLLLASFDRLPVLRVLTAGPGHHAAAFDAKEYLSLNSHFDFPAVEDMRLAGGLSWPRELPGATICGTMQTLAFAPLRASSIRAALAACPHLRALDIDVAGVEAWDCGPELRDALARVPRVRVSGIWGGIEDYVLRAVDGDGLRAGALDYRGGGCPLARPSSHPFRGVAGPLRLALALTDGTVCVAMTDASGRYREVLFDRAKLGSAPGMWYYLASLTVVSATVDAALWAYFAANSLAVRGIPELTIVLSDAADLLTVNLTAFQRGALRKLRIEMPTPPLPAPCRLSGVALASLLRTFGTERRLPTLSIPRSVEVDGISALKRFVDSVEC